MFSFENDSLLVDDREDLIAILRMRFGDNPGEMIQQIYDIDDMNMLQRLILVAANAPNWDIFVEEFQTGKDSFRLLGEEFNPLANILKGRGGSNAV
ncbi:hypothetical protein [Neobacillus soli]|uniref:hypothetical protein n=1 Tax=Neobacillus soli TaxID=220688 RepID=UPI000826CA74|nr:hypothetical protein [Neobacillus soli]